jgi:hypothetical protein
MEDRKDVEEWADAMLAKHRVDYRKETSPAPELAKLLTRDMPKVGAVMQVVQAIALFVLALLALGAVSVAFNSG